MKECRRCAGPLGSHRGSRRCTGEATVPLQHPHALPFSNGRLIMVLRTFFDKP